MDSSNKALQEIVSKVAVLPEGKILLGLLIDLSGWDCEPGSLDAQQLAYAAGNKSLGLRMIHWLKDVDVFLPTTCEQEYKNWFEIHMKEDDVNG